MLQQRRKDDLSNYTLELNPWRDGCDTCMDIIEEKATTRAVCISRHFTADELQEPSAEALDSMLDTMGTELYDLQALSIRFAVSSRSLTVATPTSSTSTITEPSLSAITTLLATCYHVQSISLLGLNWMGCDELDMNGWYEAIRIHPTLQSLEIRNCKFAKKAHLTDLKKVAVQRERMNEQQRQWSWKHLDISENIVGDKMEKKKEKTQSSSNKKKRRRTSSMVTRIAATRSRPFALLAVLLLLLALFYYAYLA